MGEEWEHCGRRVEEEWTNCGELPVLVTDRTAIPAGTIQVTTLKQAEIIAIVNRVTFKIFQTNFEAR